MRARSLARGLLAGLLLLTGSTVLLAQAEGEASGEAGSPAEEKRLWPDTGSTQHGVLEVQRGRPVSLFDMGEVDSETIQQIDRFQQRLLTSTPKDKPPLKYVVPAVERSAQWVAPPSDLGSTAEAFDTFRIFKNSAVGSMLPGGFSSTINEPAVATAGGTVLYTGNWYAAVSSDRGDTFSFVNPFSAPFPPPAASAGFCCDQVTAYDPETDAIFYLQQYQPSATNGVQRINVDQGADGTFDCFYNITPQIHGFGTNNYPDFPDLALGDDYVYHSSNVYSTVGAGFSGAFVARYNKDQMGACGSVPFDKYSDTSFFSFKLTRGATDTMYFADHISTASIRIWRWPESATSPTSFDRSVTAWSNSTRVCPGPDGRDWCGFIDRRMAAAWVADGTVGFMWVPSQGAGFAFPHTRAAQFSEFGLIRTGEPIIWSSSFAWVYPAVAVNRDGDLGGTIMAGGGVSLHPSCVAWLADDVNGDTIAPLENTVARFGTSGPSVNRSGDYSSAQAYHPYDLLFSGACFAYTGTTTADPRHLLFGRESPCSDKNLILDDDFIDLAGYYRSARKVFTRAGFAVTSALPVGVEARLAVVLKDGTSIQADAEFTARVNPSLDCSPP